MNVKMGDPFNQRIVEMGMEKEQVISIIENPDRINVFDLNLLEKNLTGSMPTSKNRLIFLYSKCFENEKGEYYVWLSAMKDETKPMIVLDGYKINAKLIPGIENMSPIEIIARLSERLGIPFTVDGEERTSIVIRYLVCREKNKLPLIEAKVPVGHTVIGVLNFKIHPDGNTAVVALKYTMDLTRYNEWLYVSRL